MEKFTGKVILAVAMGMAMGSVMAQNAVKYSVEPLDTYPAEGGDIVSFRRLRITLDRGFGPVGYDWSADGAKVYIENEKGERTYMKNAVKKAPALVDSWQLEKFSGSTSPNVHTYKDKLYNNLFTRELGWNGGDGVFTVALPGGHVFWTFNDSFYGIADAKTRARGACSFPRNTIMLQEASSDGMPLPTEDGLMWLARFNQVSKPNANGYYKAYTHLDHPNAKNFNDDGIAQDYLYWSGDGTVGSDGKLHFLWNGVDTSTGGMVAMGTAHAIYSLEGNPGEESYLKLESVNHDFMSHNPYSYGSTLWEDEDGHIYLYSSAGNGSWLGNDPIVARTIGSNLGGAWEYYVPDNTGKFVWQSEYPTEAQVKKSGIAPGQGSFTLPWVFKKGDNYYMCAQTFPFGHEMAIMTSEHPWGPFKNKKVLIKFPNPLDELQHDPYGSKYQNLYMLNLHPALSRNGEIVISTNTDIGDKDDNGNKIDLGFLGGFARNFNNPGSCDWYRPFYYRVYGWERLFENQSILGLSDCIEFMFDDGAVFSTPGKYKFVCEEGVFGNDVFETSNCRAGVANKRFEVNFTVGDKAAGVDGVDEGEHDAPTEYYNLQGIRVEGILSPGFYIVRHGNKISKEYIK